MSNLHKDAFAIRLVRIVKDEGCYYEAITFEKPWTAIDQLLRQLGSNAIIEDSEILIDIIDDSGDILDTLPITREAFRYLQRRLKFRRVREDGDRPENKGAAIAAGVNFVRAHEWRNRSQIAQSFMEAIEPLAARLDELNKTIEGDRNG